jgi:predicted Zn-dependent protease
MSNKLLKISAIIIFTAVITCGCQLLSSLKKGDVDYVKLAQAGKSAVAAVAPFSIDEEVEIGRSMSAKLIQGSGGIYPNDSVNRYVNLVGRGIAMHVNRDDLDSSMYQFVVLNTQEVNAFAAPGGYVFITLGALRLIQNEAELAGVLAHEISHVDKSHMLSSIKAAHGVNFFSQVVSAYNDNSQLNALLAKTTDVGLDIIYKKGFSQEYEKEADENALKFLVNSGYDPNGLENFLNKIKSTSDANKSMFKALTSTHPGTTERLKSMDQYSDRKGFSKMPGQKLEGRYKTSVR